VDTQGSHAKEGAGVRVDLHPTEAPTLDRRKRLELVDDLELLGHQLLAVVHGFTRRP
jgi:hypothetical protein